MARLARDREAKSTAIFRLLKRERRRANKGGAPSFSTTRSPNRALLQHDFHTIDDLTLASDEFDFLPHDPISIERAFIAHLRRFIAQGRDVSWREAPAVFAAISSGREDELLMNLFRTAMESLLDSEHIFVEELNGGNKLVR